MGVSRPGILVVRDFVRERVTEELQNQLTELQQYTRRYSVVVSGVKADATEKEEVMNIIKKANSLTTFQDVDKFHRIGHVKDDKDEKVQDLIVRFKTHDAKETFYRKRKDLDRRYRVKPSLTPERRKLLEKAREYLEEANYERENLKFIPEFVYADVHGNLKVAFKINEPNNDQKVFMKFTSLKELGSLIDKKNFASRRMDDMFSKITEAQVEQM